MSTSYPPVPGNGAAPDTVGTNGYLTEVTVIPPAYPATPASGTPSIRAA